MNEERASFSIPLQGGQNDIVLGLPDAVTPKQLGRADDTRLLSLMFFDAEVIGSLDE